MPKRPVWFEKLHQFAAKRSVSIKAEPVNNFAEISTYKSGKGFF